MSRKFCASLALVFMNIFVRVAQAGPAPTAILDNAAVTGTTNGLTNQFLGIPYAYPPTGDRRFRLPQPLPPYNTNFSAMDYGPACPQQPLAAFWPSNLPAETVNYLEMFILDAATSSEDCLTINVIAPADMTPESKLPVVVFILPGGFELDGVPLHDGALVVERGLALGIPVVYVSIIYRWSGEHANYASCSWVNSYSAFGFLASKEVKEAGVANLGLQDQRLALRWVQRYIHAFGGDPTKVTIWGYSSGAVCVALHMVTNGGDPEGLFRAAIMQGGGLVSVGDITHGQHYYNTLVTETGCSGANDTLQCLREVLYDKLIYAVAQSPPLFSYQSMNLAWMPRVDGNFLTGNPMALAQQGAIADVPFIAGNCDDEGTICSLANANITTDAEFAEYMKTNYLPNASDETIEEVMKYYPSDPTKGSPFDTGYLNALTPQYKRMAAAQGDAGFQAPRRFLLQNRAGKQKFWTYLNKRMKATPFLGSFHASDLNGLYGLSDMSSYIIRFVANADPNVGRSTDVYWPQYDAANQTMLELLDGLVSQTLTTDTYRAEEIAYMTSVILGNPL